MTTDTKALRERFENAMRVLVASGSQPGEFDDMADFWFDLLDDGRYEVTRMEDAWTGFRLAAAAIERLEAERERYRAALAELVAALEAEAKAKAAADNALENFSNPGVYVREYEKAMVRTVYATAAARATLRKSNAPD